MAYRRAARPVLITLTTDFGVADTYVAQMKAVILGIAPTTTIVDGTHEVAPRDILGGALALESLIQACPPTSIHVAVVDPGVGTDRAAIAVRTPRGYLVGPDNGVLSLVTPSDADIVLLTNRAYHREPLSRTFHGRDIFAPVAAYLYAGADFYDLGEKATGLVRVTATEPAVSADSIEAHVLHVDRFGNAITDLRVGILSAWLGPEARGHCAISLGDLTLPMAQTYGDVTPGAGVALVGSSGRIEIAIRNGNAAHTMGLHRGSSVVVIRRPS